MRVMSARELGGFYETREGTADAERETGLFFTSLGRVGAVESEESDMERLEGEEYFGARREATREDEEGDESDDRVYRLGDSRGVTENGETTDDVARTRNGWVHRSRNERERVRLPGGHVGVFTLGGEYVFNRRMFSRLSIGRKVGRVTVGEEIARDERAREESPLDFRRV